MKKRVFHVCLAFAFFISLTALSNAQSKMSVKLNVKLGEGDFVGQRLVALIQKGINNSEQLKIAGEGNFVLIVDLLTTKIKNRPSSAYSYIVTFNAYGKLSPVLMHRLGIVGNTRVYNAASNIVTELETIAAEAAAKVKKAEE